MGNGNFDQKSVNIKQKVMEGIRNKKIRMRSRIIFMAEKIGLEGALVLAVSFGVALVSLLFYFLEKSQLARFLSLGMPGIRIFFGTLPYDYIFLFALSLVLAIYFANRLEIFSGKCERTDIFATWFFLGVLLLGVLFGSLGLGKILGGWADNKIPHDRAISGKIQNFSDEEVTVIEENGAQTKVYFEIPPAPDPYSSGEFLRAVGYRDERNPEIFHAERVRCCDED